MNSEIEVELRPHVGVQQTRLGPVQVQHNQYEIFASGENGQQVRMGYVGKQPNAPINWLRQPNGVEWPDAIKQAVRQIIAERLGGADRRESQPPEPLPPEPEEWDEEDEEE